MPLRSRRDRSVDATGQPRVSAADGRAAAATGDVHRAFAFGLRASGAVALVAGVGLCVYLSWWVLKPLIVSIVLATTLWPWVSALAAAPVGKLGRPVPRVIAAALVYAATLGAVGLISWVVLVGLLPYADRLLDAYPRETALLRDYLEPFRRGDVAAAGRIVGDLAGDLAGVGGGGASQVAVRVADLALALLGGLVTLGLVLLFTFFLLIDGDRYVGWGLALLPERRREPARALGGRVMDRVSRWVFAQVAYALGSFTLVGGVMWALGLPSPWLYGAAASVMGPLPGVGPAYAVVPALLVALQIAPWKAGVVLGFGVTLWAVDTTTISPKLYGTLLRLPTFVVLLAMLLGAALMGVWGALIAAPVAAAVQTVVADRRG